MGETQICRVCSQEKALDRFYSDNRNKNGKRKTCKDCDRAAGRARYAVLHPRRSISSKYVKVEGREEPAERTCRVCKNTLPIESFHRHKRMGHQRDCKSCQAEQHRLDKQDPARMAILKRQMRDSEMRRNFGITLLEYETMESAQNGKCAICGGTSGNRRLAVDHHHGTGRVRALLCSGCNTGLGSFRDNPALLDAAIAYLREHTD